METITVESIDIFVNHHGVLGQKYGVKNGPPYPLEEGDHSSSEESAAKKAGISVGTSSGKGSLDNVESDSDSTKTTKKKTVSTLQEVLDNLDTMSDDEIKKSLSTLKSKNIVRNYDSVYSGDFDKLKTVMDSLDWSDLDNAIKKSDRMTSIRTKEALNSGDIKKIQSVMKDVDSADLTAALQKRSTMKAINKMADPSLYDKIKKTSETLRDVSTTAENLISFYNTGVKVLNSFTPTDLPSVSAAGPMFGKKIK